MFDALGIRFWINSGTLLGWLRQCGWIGHALDVDVGVFADEYTEELIPAMQKAGLRISHRFGVLNDSFELSFEVSRPSSGQLRTVVCFALASSCACRRSTLFFLILGLTLFQCALLRP